MKKKYLYGIIAVVALGLFAAINMKQSITPYVGVAEAKRAVATTVQVNGKLVKNSSKYDIKSGNLTFKVRDSEGAVMDVSYPKTEPANFKQSTGLVIIGKYENGKFMAKELLVKCPSKYEKKAEM